MSKKTPPLKWFFYDGVLYKALHVSSGADTILAWNFEEGCSKTLSYTDVRRRGGKAYNFKDVCQLLNKGRRTIQRHINEGDVERPIRAYTVDERRRPLNYRWSADDVLKLHDYFVELHQGRPRKDGRITAGNGLPTRTELKAMLRGDPTLWIRNEDGEFIPTWKAEW